MNPTLIKRWLLGIAVLIVLIIMVGGITRLTESGLSMVKWQPILGVLPPVTEGQWEAVFAQYKQFPQYAHFPNMTLASFKKIFFWEYLHRILGRLLGLVVVIPLAVFLKMRVFPKGFGKRAMIMTLWIGAQGVLGWYMVKSGLVHNPRVSHFRLAMHLLTAFFLFQYVMWAIWDLSRSSLPNPAPALKKWSMGLLGLVTLQIGYGAFVAGLRAGIGFNTFPKMGQSWMPKEVWFYDSVWTNLVSNPVMVQFIHRTLGWAVFFAVIGLAIWGYKRANLNQKKTLIALTAATIFQFLLGVATLVLKVPITLAVLHQLGALLVLTLSMRLVYESK